MARIQSVIDTVSREFVHSSADCVTSRHGTNYCCWNYACRPCILCTVTGIWQERTLWLRQSLNMYSRPIYTAALCWISSISTEVVEQLEYTDWRVYLREMQIQELHEARCVWRWFNAAVIGRVYNLQLPARVCYSQADKQKKTRTWRGSESRGRVTWQRCCFADLSTGDLSPATNQSPAVQGWRCPSVADWLSYISK